MPDLVNLAFDRAQNFGRAALHGRLATLTGTISVDRPRQRANCAATSTHVPIPDPTQW